ARSVPDAIGGEGRRGRSAVRQYILKRLLLAIPTVLGAVTLVFFAIRLAPGDPVALFIPPDVGGDAKEEMVQRIRAQYGFDRPIYEQYVLYVTRMARLDFGQSIRQKTDVAEDLARRIPNTFQLGLVSLVVSMVLGVGLGVLSAVSRGSWFDNLTMFL